LKNRFLVNVIIATWFLSATYQALGQDSINTSTFFIPEILIGKTLEANTDFPKTNLQTALLISFGKQNSTNDDEWAYRLRHPKTGVTIGIIDFGNTKKIGKAYTVLPFIEFGLFKKKKQRFNLHIGMGGSYMDTRYDSIKNPFNQGITTKLNWSFRSFLYYDIYKTERIDWRFGLGYFHHSNGHTRLPNQGVNSLLASVSASINSSHNSSHNSTQIFEVIDNKKSSQPYFDLRTGLGQNVLSEIFNDKKEVFSVAASAGKIINRTFKFGIGFYYRHYEHYHDYIQENQYLIEEQVPHFKNNPSKYAKTYGMFFSSELLMSHIGFEGDIGINFYKPFYKIDWQLNQGYSYETYEGETVVVLGELNSYYKLKRTISARLGLKYYLLSNNNSPKNNLYLGAHINANLGQADFTELSLGFVHRFNLKQK
jgi:hypothetical protein